MPIHIHLPQNTTTSLFTITDELYDALESPFETLEQKTGIFIDPYSDSRLTHQHAALLLRIINDEIATNKLLPIKTVIEFTGFLEKLVREQIDVEFIGD
jgi:hypothetical protein